MTDLPNQLGPDALTALLAPDLVRLLEAGDPSTVAAVLGAAAKGSPPSDEVELPDGSIGWPVRGGDDCWCAAIACATQIPLEEFPDLQLDGRVRAGMSPARVDRMALRELREFLAEWDLVMVRHRRPPVDSPRWVGVIPIGGKPFMSHCLVMSGPEVLFDPTGPAAEALGRRPRVWTPAHVRHGWTFEPLSSSTKR